MKNLTYNKIKTQKKQKLILNKKIIYNHSKLIKVYKMNKVNKI